MHQFTDTKGRQWDVSLSLGSVLRVDKSDFTALTKEEFSFAVPDRQTLQLIFTNAPLQAAIIWAVIKPQADKLGVDENEFLDGIDGEVWKKAKDAFFGAIADFFPETKTALSALKRNIAKAKETIEEVMGEMNPAMEQAFMKAIQKEAEKVRKQLEALGNEHGGESTV